MRSRQLLHFDGRLDNRTDLLLLLRDRVADDTSDAALALAAYDRWGVDGLARLIGDWSLVIRDAATGATILSSDYAGVRPLHYHVQPARVLWSSRLQVLVNATRISDLDDEYVRGFLLHGASPDRTPYRGIYSVPPGHAVCVLNGNITIRRFWSPPTGDQVRYRDERQYEEQLRALFREAVAVRLQSNAPVLAELSGGLDSSSVVCIASELIRSGAVPAPRLATVSFLWRNSLDEPSIREVESHCGIDEIHISTHEVPLEAEAQTGNAMPEQFQPLCTSVAAAAHRLGAINRRGPPGRQRTSAGTLMRNSTSGRWANGCVPWQGALLPLAAALLKTRQLQVVERGFVDGASVLTRLERLCAGLDCNTAQLRQIMLLEFWLRNRTDGAPSEQGRRAA